MHAWYWLLYGLAWVAAAVYLWTRYGVVSKLLRLALAPLSKGHDELAIETKYEGNPSLQQSRHCTPWRSSLLGSPPSGMCTIRNAANAGVTIRNLKLRTERWNTEGLCFSVVSVDIQALKLSFVWASTSLALVVEGLDVCLRQKHMPEVIASAARSRSATHVLHTPWSLSGTPLQHTH
jgi:hypothetical protein